MLDEYLDPTDAFRTSLENKPLSRLSGIFQKRRGLRNGLPDVLVIWRGKPIFIELKSRAGVASKAQKQIRAKLKPAGADWWLARGARAALMALHLSGVVFRRQWKPPRLKPDRSRTRTSGCRKRRMWPHGDWPHDGNGGCVSGCATLSVRPTGRKRRTVLASARKTAG